jgi:hypothetical protein
MPTGVRVSAAGITERREKAVCVSHSDMGKARMKGGGDAATSGGKRGDEVLRLDSSKHI